MTSARIARLGLLALGGFVAAVGLEHALRPDLPPARHFVSEYGRGSTRILQSAAFVAWAGSMVAAAALAVRLPDGPGRPARLGRWVTTGALGLSAAGALLCAAFMTQTVGGQLPGGVRRTTAGRLHDLGTLLVLAGLVVAALAALAALRDRRYTVEAVVLALVLVAVVPVLVALHIDAPGWGQRAFIAVGCTWLWRFDAAVLRGPGAQRNA